MVLVDTVFYAALTPLVPYFTGELGLSKSVVGVLSGAFGAGVLLGSAPGGFLVARLGARPSAVLGLAMISASSLLFGFAGEAWQLVVLRLLAGSAGAGALGMFRAESAAADCRGRGGACTRDEQCCSRLCSGEGRCRCRREGAPCRFGGGRFDGACCSQRCRRDGTCA